MQPRTDAHFMFLRIKMQRIPDLVPSILALNGSIVIMRRTLKNRAPDYFRKKRGGETKREPLPRNAMKVEEKAKPLR